MPSSSSEVKEMHRTSVQVVLRSVHGQIYLIFHCLKHLVLRTDLPQAVRDATGSRGTKQRPVLSSGQKIGPAFKSQAFQEDWTDWPHKVSVDSDLEEHTGEGLKIQWVPESNSGMAANRIDLNH